MPAPRASYWPDARRDRCAGADPPRRGELDVENRAGPCKASPFRRTTTGSGFAEARRMEHAVSEVEGGVGPGSPWGDGLRVRSERRAVGLALVSLGLGSAQVFFP